VAISVAATVSGAGLVGFFAGCGTSSSEGAATALDSSFVQMSEDGAAPAVPSDAHTSDAPADGADLDASDGGDGGAMSCPGAMAQLDAAIGTGVCGQCLRTKCVTFTGECQQDCACIEALATIITCYDLMASAGDCEQSLSGLPASVQNVALACDFNCESACDPNYQPPTPDAAVDASADDAGDAARD
jgi:hypothetical protein